MDKKLHAAASPIVDDIFMLIDKGIEAVGEETLVAVINEKIDIPYMPESMEAVVLGIIIKRIHQAVHKNPVPPVQL